MKNRLTEPCANDVLGKPHFSQRANMVFKQEQQFAKGN